MEEGSPEQEQKVTWKLKLEKSERRKAGDME
jgi:hypothetical protein